MYKLNECQQMGPMMHFGYPHPSEGVDETVKDASTVLQKISLYMVLQKVSESIRTKEKH
jgi:hypothetical protein